MRPASLMMLTVLALLPVAVTAAEEQPVDMEMLEYLGTFQTAGGRPVDPQFFGREDASKKNGSRAEQLKKRNQPRQKDQEKQKGHDDEN